MAKKTPLVTKAEVLLTRRCNLACGTCAVVDPAKDARGRPVLGEENELTLGEWKRAFDVIYRELGATFIALYGGEPLTLGDEKLVGIIEHLATYRTDTRDFTIISNAIGLTRERAEKFVKAGLQSWTSSVDTTEVTLGLAAERSVNVGDAFMNAKTSAGLRALAMMKSMGLRDTCGIITVTAMNLDDIIPTVEWLCAQGHWVGIDLLHWQRGDGEYTFSSTKEQMDAMGLTLTEEHMPMLAAIAETLLQKHSELLVFPTRRVLEMWKDPDFAIRLGWKCTPGHSITLDHDGTIGLCDDRMPNGYGNYRHTMAKSYLAGERDKPVWSIFDFEDGQEIEVYTDDPPKRTPSEKWGHFMSWYTEDLKLCEGCAWSTHVMAVDALENPLLRKHYVHQATPADLLVQLDPGPPPSNV